MRDTMPAVAEICNRGGVGRQWWGQAKGCAMRTTCFPAGFMVARAGHTRAGEQPPH